MNVKDTCAQRDTKAKPEPASVQNDEKNTVEKKAVEYDLLGRDRNSPELQGGDFFC